MKYYWLATVAILLSAGAADIANATTYKDIAGQWCGDVTDYVFTPSTLTVKFHDGRPENVFTITKYTYTNDSVRIDWLNDAGKESVTGFAEFVGNATTMAQQQNDDRPPWSAIWRQCCAFARYSSVLFVIDTHPLEQANVRCPTLFQNGTS